MSALNQLFKDPVIPFIRKKEEKDLRKITLQHTVTVNVVIGGNPTVYREKRTAQLVIANDDDVEVLIRLGITFLEAAGADSLSLPERQYYTEFRKCLEDILLDTFDNLLSAIPAPNRTAANFVILLNDLIGHFTDPTAFADQKRYMDTYKKPFKLSVRELSNRLVIVNKYSQYLPGSNGSSIYDGATIKYALFNMMLPQWQLAFAGSAHSELSDPAYTYAQLTRYMTTQETIHNSRVTATQRSNRGHAGNFGRGRGGRQQYRPYPYPQGNNPYGGNFRGRFQPRPYIPQSAPFPARGYPQGRAPASKFQQPFHRGGRGFQGQARGNPNAGRGFPNMGGRYPQYGTYGRGATYGTGAYMGNVSMGEEISAMTSVETGNGSAQEAFMGDVNIEHGDNYFVDPAVQEYFESIYGSQTFHEGYYQENGWQGTDEGTTENVYDQLGNGHNSANDTNGHS